MLIMRMNSAPANVAKPTPTTESLRLNVYGNVLGLTPEKQGKEMQLER